MTDHELMQAALQRAREGMAQGGSPFGACLARDGAIIACEHNRVWQTTDSTAHAEIVTLRAACARLGTIDLSGCTLYSTTEPCPMCFSAAHWAKVSRIVFGTRIADARQLGFGELSISNAEMQRLGPSPVQTQGDFLRDEALLVFQEWSSRPDRRAY